MNHLSGRGMKGRGIELFPGPYSQACNSLSDSIETMTMGTVYAYLLVQFGAYSLVYTIILVENTAGCSGNKGLLILGGVYDYDYRY